MRPLLSRLGALGAALGLIVDIFAGAGGASSGLAAATGRPVDIAINHDPVALAIHARNHPETRRPSRRRRRSPRSAVAEAIVRENMVLPPARQRHLWELEMASA